MALSLPGGGWKQGELYNSIVVLVHDYQNPESAKLKVQIKAYMRMKDVKDIISPMIGIHASKLRLYFHGKEVHNSRTVLEVGAVKYGDVIGYSIIRPAITRTLLPNIYPYGQLQQYPKSVLRMVHQAQQGLSLGYAPELAMDGTGGTYFLRNAKQRTIGCFKPQDEEPYGPCNPRGFRGELKMPGFRPGIFAGEACEREVAAYMLDIDGFAQVPPTALAEVLHPVFQYNGKEAYLKLGSLQQYMRHDDVVSDLSPSKFSVQQVHKIAILDIRLLNTDRNDANILVKRKRAENATQPFRYELIPIDHGYCLPDKIEIAWCDWCWFNWPQLSEPMSKETIKYILDLNVDEQANILETKISMRQPCISMHVSRNMKIAGRLLQGGVKAGLLLSEIASILCRENLDIPSTLESYCEIALADKTERFNIKKGEPLSEVMRSMENATERRELNATMGSSSDDGTTAFSMENLLVNSSALSSSPPGFWASRAPSSKKSPSFANSRRIPWDSGNGTDSSSPDSSDSDFSSFALANDTEKAFFATLDRLLSDEFNRILAKRKNI